MSKLLNPRHISEAKAAGLRLLSRHPEYPNSMIYECPNCKAHVPIRVETVRKLAQSETAKLYDCENCKLLAYEQQAADAGLKIIGPTSDGHYLRYSFIECGHNQEITKDAVKKREFSCRTCLADKLEAEANKRNLTIVGKGSNPHYRLYRNTICEHQYELVTSHVRLAGERNEQPYPCSTCLSLQRVAEAKAAGLFLYGETNRKAQKNKSYLYHAPCGHSIERRADQIRVGEWRCQACVDTKLNEEAEKAGLLLIGKGSNKAYRSYQFKACEHTKEIPTAHVRKGTFHCDVCFWDDVDAVLSNRRLKILDRGKKGDSRLFQFLDCGHIQDIELQRAKDGSFVCHECDETFYTLPSNLYLLHMIAPDFEWLKLGYAKVVETRVKQYRLPHNTIVEPLAVVPTQTGEAALKLEKLLERKHKDKKLEPMRMRRWHRIVGSQSATL
jgi:predicted RNA-binding Zn-ribbon protein involved in translation (DUF1610 family)